MKKRFIYSILFGIPALIVSVIIAIIVFGFAAGALWIYAFGDNPWPASVEKILSILFILVFLVVWIALIIIGFVIGKHLEQNPILNKKHILISVGITITFILFIAFYQLRIGNIGTKSVGLQCSNYCSQIGYSASSVSPQDSDERMCGCLDNSGLEVISIPIDNIAPGK
jgi:hypothetical protein